MTGAKSFTLKSTRSNRIVHIVCEQSIIIFNATCLVSQLPVDGEMVTFTHEYNSGWIIINTVDTNWSLTAHHSVECYMLIGVGEQTACKDGVAQAIAMAKPTNFSFFILIILNKTSAKVIIMFYFAIGFIKYLKHINAKALSLAQI